MNLYGFRPGPMIGLVSRATALPHSGVNGTGPVDINYNTAFNYTDKLPNLGCPALPLNCTGNVYFDSFPNWLATTNANLDLRAMYSTCVGGTHYVTDSSMDWPTDDQVLGTISPITGLPVAFTTESIFYAQSGYFVTVVLVQWSNVFACKSRKVSLIYSAFNKHMFFGILVETILFIFLLYVPGVNGVFGGRPLNFFVLGIPGLGFSMLLLIWEESRKFLINMDSNNGNPNWWQKNLLW